MSLIIREAGAKDAPLLEALGSASYRYHFEQYWASRDELQAFIRREYSQPVLLESLADPTVRWLVAENGGPVGFAKISWDRPVPGQGHTGALLNKLYLAPNETGRGYGKRLFEKMIQLAKEKEQGYLWLEVLEGNEGASRFYLAQGMCRLGRETFSSVTQTSILHIFGKPI